MDIYGIGAYVEDAMRQYREGARGIGRTTRLVNTISAGDTVVFDNSVEARRVAKLCADLGKPIKVVIIPVHADAFQLHGRRNLSFDHTWVERYYTNGIKQLGRALDEIRFRSEH